MHLMIDNLPPEVTEEDLRSLLSEIGTPAPTEVTIAQGSRNRPSAAVAFNLEHAQMEAIAGLLNGRYWREHVLHATHSTLFR